MVMYNDLEFLYTLEPQHDTRKSFYNKAKVFRNSKGSILLMSYSTIVAEIVDEIVEGERKVKVFGWYSNTTARHINEFLQQNGFDKMSKKEMEEMEV